MPTALIFLMLGVIISSCNTTSEPAVKRDGLVVFAAASDVGLGSARIPLGIQKLDGTRFDDAAGRLEVNYSLPSSPDSDILSACFVTNPPRTES